MNSFLLFVVFNDKIFAPISICKLQKCIKSLLKEENVKTLVKRGYGLKMCTEKNVVLETRCQI